MRGSLETIVGAMFAGKTSELLKEFSGQNIKINKLLLLNQASIIVILNLKSLLIMI
mgnify:CR=1 FL=1